MTVTTSSRLVSALVVKSLKKLKALLVQLAGNEPLFREIIATSFGEGADASAFQKAWAKKDFSEFPPIEIRQAEEINGANGAFAAATGKVYLAQEFLDVNADTPDPVTAVLLEEYGHFIDARINREETPGDEGDIFSRLVRGESISEAELAALRAEDDGATVMLDGRLVRIEQNGNITSTNPNSKNVHYYLGWGPFGIGDIYYCMGSATVTADDSNNWIYGGNTDRSGNITVNITSGKGANTIYLDSQNVSSNSITVGNGNNTIWDYSTGGSGYTDTIKVGNGNNNIWVGNENSIITVGTGNNTITTGDGNNTIYATSGIVNVEFGSGNNTINYKYSSGPITVTPYQYSKFLVSGGSTVEIPLVGTSIVVNGNTSHFNNVENLIGSNYGDLLHAMSGSFFEPGNTVATIPNNYFLGTIQAGNGNDQLFALSSEIGMNRTVNLYGGDGFNSFTTDINKSGNNISLTDNGGSNTFILQGDQTQSQGTSKTVADVLLKMGLSAISVGLDSIPPLAVAVLARKYAINLANSLASYFGGQLVAGSAPSASNSVYIKNFTFGKDTIVLPKLSGIQGYSFTSAQDNNGDVFYVNVNQNGVSPVTIATVQYNNWKNSTQTLTDYLLSSINIAKNDYTVGDATASYGISDLDGNNRFTVPNDLNSTINISESARNDSVVGAGGNETIYSGQGNDTIDGVNGYDTVIYHGLRSKYTITSLGNQNYQITDNGTSKDGTDTLRNVESIKFTDTTIKTSTRLLFDNFANTNTTPDGTALNYNLAGRQSGSLGNVTWVSSSNDWKTQIGNSNTGNIDNGNYLLTAFGGTAALAYDFNQDVSQGGIRIDFDLAPNISGNTTDQTVWGSFKLGLSDTGKNAFVNGGGFGILFRANGGIQAFDNGSDVTGNYANTKWGTNYAQLNHFTVVATDPTDENPFNGSGETDINVYNQSGILIYSYKKTDGGYTDNYINFGSNIISAVDNVGVTPFNPTELLSDNFTVTGTNDVTNLNAYLYSRQSGSFGNILWQANPKAASWQMQVGNSGTGGITDGNYLLTASNGTNATAALNHNFNGADSLGGLKISFDLAPDIAGTPDNNGGGTLNLGLSSANENASLKESGFGILFRAKDGVIQSFDNGNSVFPTAGNGKWGTDYAHFNHFTVVATDPTVGGDGNPFDGKGSTKIDIYNGDKNLIYSYTKGSGGYTDNYLNFGTYDTLGGYTVSGIDNLTIAHGNTI